MQTNPIPYGISRYLTENALRQRLIRDVEAGRRTPDVIARSVQRLKLYDLLDTVKLDVSAMPPEEAARRIRALAE